MNIPSILFSLGLSLLESKIYICLLQVHRASVSLISKETGIYRPTVYRLLPKLVDTGLISQVKVGKRICYIAENPKKLERLVENVKSECETALPDLKRMYDGSQKRPAVRYLEGKKAIQRIFQEMVERSKKGDEIYRYESPRDFKLVGKYYPDLYWKRATGPNGELEKFVITNEETVSKRSNRIWRHVRSIPASFDSFDYNITELIYKDTVAFIDYDTETATLIKNKRFADFQLKIFKMLFSKLSK